MLLVAHHIAWDDGSWQVFFADLTSAYGGEPSHNVRPTPAPQRTESVRHDDRSRVLARGDGRSARAAGTSRPAGIRGAATWRSQSQHLRLSADTVERVAALARETGATPYMVLLAAFSAR